MKETEVRVGEMAILSWSGLASWRRWHLSQVLKEVLAVKMVLGSVPGLRNNRCKLKLKPCLT